MRPRAHARAQAPVAPRVRRASSRYDAAVTRTLAGLLISCALAGCDTSVPAPARMLADACRLAVERQIVCAEPDRRRELGEVREMAIDRCENYDFRRVEDDRDTLACVELTGCEAFAACMVPVQRRVDARPRMVDVMRALRNLEDVDGALTTCSAEGASDPELAALCEELYQKTLAGMTAELTAARDHGQPVEAQCEKARADAQRMSPEVARAVQSLCEEATASATASQAESDVAQFAALRFEGVPRSCEAALVLLDPLSTPWARRRRAAVVDACYVGFGRKFLPRAVARRRCDEPVVALYRAYRGGRFSDPELATLLVKAERACPALRGAK